MTWTREALRAEIVRILEEHRSTDDAPAIDDHTHLSGDLGIDSLATMEVIADVEDALGVKIPVSSLREVSTVGDVLRALEVRLRDAGRLA
ncbi:MAG: acyl carrier protein [Nannocystaceae bacterium]